MVAFLNVHSAASVLLEGFQSQTPLGEELAKFTETPVYEIPADLLNSCRTVKGPYAVIPSSVDPTAKVFFCTPPLSSGNMGGVFLGFLVCGSSSSGQCSSETDSHNSALFKAVLHKRYGRSIPNDLSVARARSVVVKFNTNKAETKISAELRYMETLKHPLFAQALGSFNLGLINSFSDSGKKYVGPGAVIEYLPGPTLESYLETYAQNYGLLSLDADNAEKDGARIEEWDNQLSCFIAQVVVAQAFTLSQGVMNEDMHYENMIVLPSTSDKLQYRFTNDIHCPRLKFIDLGLAYPIDNLYNSVQRALGTVFLTTIDKTFRPISKYHPGLETLINKVLCTSSGPSATMASSACKTFRSTFQRVSKSDTLNIPFKGTLNSSQLQKLFFPPRN